MRESRKSGSVGALGERSPGATRPATITGALTATITITITITAVAPRPP
jgi:hypothetical protein